MFTVFHRRLREEEGISLVEVLVSILLMGVVLMALGSTLTAAMASARQSESLTQATALGNLRLERLQRIPWAAVGLFSDDPGYSDSVALGGQYATVDLGAAPSPRTTSPAPLPVEAVTFGGRRYTVTTAIVTRCTIAAEPTCSGQTKTYRQITQRITWNGGAESLVVEARRTLTSFAGAGAGGGELVLEDPYRITSFNVAPDPVRIRDDNNRLAETMTIQVETSHDTDNVQLSSSAVSGAMVKVNKRFFTFTLAAPTGQFGQHPAFPHGAFTFTVTATEDVSAVSPPRAARTASSMAQGYFVYTLVRQSLNWDNNLNRLWTGTASATGDRICADAVSKRLRNDNLFTVTYKGLTPDDWVRLERVSGASGTGWTYDLVPSTTTAGVTTFTLNLTPTAGGSFTGTSTEFRLHATRVYDNVTSTLNLPLYVSYLNGANPC